MLNSQERSLCWGQFWFVRGNLLASLWVRIYEAINSKSCRNKEACRDRITSDGVATRITGPNILGFFGGILKECVDEKNDARCKFWDFYSGVVEESVLLGYDVTSLGKRFTTFRRITFPSKCRDHLPNDVTSYSIRTNSSIQDAHNWKWILKRPLAVTWWEILHASLQTWSRRVTWLFRRT
jgi:hypothetical protein